MFESYELHFVGAVNRLIDFDIYVTSDNHNPPEANQKSLCAHVDIIPKGAQDEIICGEPLMGRYDLMCITMCLLTS